MRAVFEDDEFRPLNVGLHPIGKAGREHVVPAKRNLRRDRDLAEMRFDIMRNHRMRLSQKGVQRLLLYSTFYIAIPLRLLAFLPASFI